VHDDYHKASDDADKVNGAGIARVVSLASGSRERLPIGRSR
jgi:hypothetical protein